MQRGYSVLTPFGVNQRYDLVIGYLRVKPPRNHQKMGIRWASDYELPG